MTSLTSSVPSYNTTTFDNWGTWSLPATGSGRAYATSCNALWHSWESYRRVHATKTWTTETIISVILGAEQTSCGFVVVADAKSTQTSLASWTALDFDHFDSDPTPSLATVTPSCQIPKTECNRIWDERSATPRPSLRWMARGSPRSAPLTAAPEVTAFPSGNHLDYDRRAAGIVARDAGKESCVWNRAPESYAHLWGFEGDGFSRTVPHCIPTTSVDNDPCNLVVDRKVKLLYYPVPSTVSRDMCASSPTGGPAISVPTDAGPVTEHPVSQPFDTKSVYLSIEKIAALDNWAIPVGGVYCNKIIPIASSRIFSHRRFVNSRNEVTSAPYSFNFADLNSPIPPSAYLAQWRSNDDLSSTGRFTVVKDQTLDPFVVIPPEILALDPAWASCNIKKRDFHVTLEAITPNPTNPPTPGSTSVSGPPPKTSKL